MRRFVDYLLIGASLAAFILLVVQANAAVEGSMGLFAVKLNSAISMSCLCLACWFASDRTRRLRGLAIALACIAGVIGLVSIGAHMFAVALPIDDGAADGPIGRMGGNSALLFMTLGSGIALGFARHPKAQTLADALVLAGTAIALTSLIAYLFESRAQYPFASHDPMALPTALVGLSLGLVIILKRSDRGLGELLNSNASGGVMARRLIPVLMIAPVLIARFALLAVEAGAFDTAFAAALSVIASVAILFFVLAGTARIIERLDSVRRGNEAQIRQMVHDLTRTNRELESFSYSISHDLRAPIRHIAGFTELLQAHARGTLDAKAQRYVATIAESAENAGRLIDELLEFSRIGRAALQTRDLDLRELFEEQWRRLALERRDREITMKVDALPRVHADPTLTGVVVANLLSNAIKYTQPREHAVVHVSGRPEGDHVVVAVRDNGVGFDMKYVDKLFGVFQRLHGEEFAGSGIGLASVKRIVERHGGHVSAHAELDGGATFELALPAAKETTS